MRSLIAVAALVLLAGCSSPDEPTSEPTAPESTTSSPSASSEAASASGSCTLLEPAQAEDLVGAPVGDPEPGLAGGALPDCRWTAADGRYVQVVAVPADAWSQGLPQALRALEASGLLDDGENARKLRAGAELVEGGEVLSPQEACALFSRMLEVQGLPAGSLSTLNVIPSRDDPQVLTGQMCSSGHFTSVTMGDQEGLDEPLPLDEVEKTLQQVHRSTLE